MALTAKQRKHLRSMVHNMEPVLIVGKSNINEGLIAHKEGYGGRGVVYDTYEWTV